MPKASIWLSNILMYNFLILKRFIHWSTVLCFKNILFIFSIHFPDPEDPCGLPFFPHTHSQIWKFLAFQTIWPLQSKYINQSIEVLTRVDLFIIVQYFKIKNQRHAIFMARSYLAVFEWVRTYFLNIDGNHH